MAIIIIINAGKKVWSDKNPKSSERKKKTKQKYSVFSLSQRLCTGVTDFIQNFTRIPIEGIVSPL